MRVDAREQRARHDRPKRRMHTHSSDQVLFVTAGKGIIGATPDSAFSHIALTAKGGTTTQVES